MKLLLLILLTFSFSTELEVDGNLKLQGDLIFQDQSTMVTAAEKLPAGVMFPFAGLNPPEGYLICAGQEVSRLEYASLFEVIGELYGSGDGQTTFNLPDLRGRMPLGKDSMNGTSANRVENQEADSLGGNAGAEMHQLTVEELASHSHSVPGMGGFPNGSTTYSPGGNGGHPNYQATGSGESTSVGSDMPHNNMPPYLTVNYIIKY